MSPRPLLCLCLLAFAVAGLRLPAAATVVPADTLAVIGWSPSPQAERAPAALREELAALPWDEAGETLEALLAHAAAGETVGPLRGVARTMQTLFTEAGPVDGVIAACPAAGAVLEGERLPLPVGGFALAAGAPERPAWFAALGGLALVARFDAEGMARIGRLLDALASCEGLAGRSLTDGDAALRLDVYRAGGLLPLAVGRAADVLVLSASPERARALLERALAEPEAPLLPAMPGAAGGLAVDLDFAAAGRLLAPDAERHPGAARLAATLNTLGHFQARLGSESGGLASRSRLAVNPDGGDAALRDLLLCRDCAVDPDVAAPAGTVGVSSRYLNLSGWLDYADGWVRHASGGEQTLRGWLTREYGLDPDALLLDWIGDEVHRIELAPLDSRLGSLVWLPPQALVLPVTDDAAAREGVEALLEALAALPLEAMLAERAGADLGMLASTQWARREASYRGVDVTRLHAGPFASLAWAVADGRLILATPARAMEPMLDAVLAGERPAGLPVRGGAPDGAHAIARVDGPATYRGLEELFAALAQPAAYVTRLGLETATGGVGSQAAGGETTVGPLAGRISLPEGATSVSVEGVLAPAQGAGRHFRLQGLPTDRPVTVELTSDTFDTYLSLIDVDAGGIVRENDDAPDTSRSAITFWPRQGTDYWVRVGSYGDSGAGPYRLAAAVAERAADLPAPAESLDVSDGPASVSGTLGPERRPLLYRLESMDEPREVSVALASSAFDTYLYLVDPVTGAVLAENDDAPDTTRSALEFVAEPGREYWLQVDSYQGGGAGAFTLSASTGPAASAAPEVLQPVATEEIEPQGLTVGGEPVTGRLGGAAAAPVQQDYAMDGLAPGDRVQVDLEAGAFDTYLYLIDAASGRLLMENDDYAGSLDRSRLTFRVNPEREYVLRVGSFGGEGTGPFRLELTRLATAGAVPAERPAPPTFGELLTLYGLLPDATGVLARHLAPGGGYGVVEGDTVRSESVLPWRED
ncbi:hypothetical protein [Sediminicurvatus halobius]|uniref:Peptidase C-terminal archaeal/bacterial domain-containing protein n=1 Tax=Sediminicurvatus halobius TaxID=2182432 RepID=A0A2U2N338_9GAMM|nr:hypothetical protein [Spiribacter halobius]PWG63503.1 hypothetical protein DEM34_08025 [Spiribacter halobius]UEX79626.1 hypothetical protein LMH63_08260 [Spiribacter halobius]